MWTNSRFNLTRVRVFLLATATATSMITTIAQAADTELVTAGFGKVKIGGLFQIWTLDDTGAPADTNTNFRMRRAEVKINGTVDPKIRWFVMFDPAKSIAVGTGAAPGDNKILQDLGIVYTVMPDFELMVGQFKVITTAEGLDSSGELLFPERAFVTRNYGDRREPGAEINYDNKTLQVRIMASNGQPNPGNPGTNTSSQASTNVNDNNNAKDVAARIDYKLLEGLKLGAFYNQSAMTTGTGQRWGANVGAEIEKLNFRAEAVTAKELDIERMGLAADAAYKITDEWQPAFRYETFQQMTSNEFTADAMTLGINYYLEGKHAKIQLAGTLMHNMNGNQGTYLATSTPKDGTVVVLNVQAAL